MSTFNFSSLQKKADQTLHNADEAIRKWVDFIQAPAGDVSFQYYDKNGNLQTTTFPNRNKIVNDFITNVNSAMTKTFYVDSINGSDLNDGSKNAPFQTIKRAIDSIPPGGAGEIILIGYGSATTYDISSDIHAVNKTIKLRADITNGRAVIKQVSYPYSSYTGGYSFVLSGSSLFIYSGIDLITGVKDAGATSNTPTSSFGLIRGATPIEGQGNVGFTVFVDNANVEINHLSFITSGSAGWFTNFSVIIHGGDSTWTFNDIGNMIGMNNSTLRLSWYSGFSYTDNTSRNITTQADVISGIVKDANGVPRNVVSNLIL